MNRMKLAVPTLLSVAIALSAGCTQTRDTSTATVRSFATVIKDSAGKTIARGSLSLPTDITERARFSGSCTFQVPAVPDTPSSQRDYALLCLSKNNGTLSGTARDGVVRIELHPQADDNTIYLEGTINGEWFSGKFFHQSFPGSEYFGTFEAKIQEERIP